MGVLLSVNNWHFHPSTTTLSCIHHHGVCTFLPQRTGEDGRGKYSGVSEGYFISFKVDEWTDGDACMAFFSPAQKEREK